jgi:hypothetical protein
MSTEEKFSLSNSENCEDEDVQTDEILPTDTQAELKRLVKIVQKRNGKSDGAIDNAKSAYNGFLKSRGLRDDSPIGGMFDDSERFETYLSEYDGHMRRNGKSSSTRASYLTHVRDYKNIHNSLVVKELPDSFPETLVTLIRRAGFTIYGFWLSKVKSLVGKTTLRVWCTGKLTPSVKSIGTIAEIEKILQVKEGTLLNRLPKRLRGTSKRPTGMTSFGKKMQEAYKNRYGKWNDHVEEQFKKLTALMASTVKSEKYDRGAVWTSSDGADVPHADVVQSLLRSFFGFCCLPKADPDPYRIEQVDEDERAVAYNSGMGMKQEQTSLALLAVKGLAVTYLEFQRVRAGGVYTTGAVTYIAMVTSLLRPGKGFLYQHPEYAEDLTGIIEDDGLTWHERCTSTRARLLDFLKSIEETDSIEYGRDPMEPIQPILDHDRPLTIIFLMLAAIKKDMPPPNAHLIKRAQHFRNYLLLLMLTAVPLRIRMYSIMRIGKHLVKEANGSWWLKFSPKDFKNRNAKRRKRGSHRNSSRKRNRGGAYKVQLPPEVWPDIEEYIGKHRPHLIGASLNNYLFLPGTEYHPKKTSSDKPKNRNTKGRLTTGSLGDIVRTMTYFYVPVEGSPGFGPHAFRHIVATDIIKKDPSVGFFLAAVALNDEIETVEEEYIHLKTSEYFKPVSEHFALRMHQAEALMAA